MEINSKQKKQIAAIAQKMGLLFVVLFGSAAQGKMKEKSDVDVAILKRDYQSMNHRDFFSLASEISEVLQAGFKIIDLVDLAKVNPLLKKEITTFGQLLYGDENDYEDYKIHALNDYLDSQSLRDLELFLIQKRQKILNGASL